MKKIIVTILLLISHINVYSVGTGDLSQTDQEKANDQLLNAAVGGDINLVDSALQSGANVNADNNHGYTALMQAAGQGHTEIVKLLLDAPGIDVNAASNDGNTSLMLAAMWGHAEIVKLLLDAQGIDVKAANNIGNTALMLAAWQGHAEIVKLLLANGANVNAANKYGDTALMMAEEKGHTQIAELLLISSPEKMKDSLEQLKEIQPQTKYFASGLNALIQELVKPEEESWSMCKKVGGVMLCGAALAAALKYGMSQS